MITPKLIEHLFAAASIQRWNDYPRMVSLVELDKQAHKFIIAYFLAKTEEDEVNMLHLVEAGIFEFLRRVVVTDIRPDVFHKALEKKTKEINQWVLTQLHEALLPIENGEFYARFEQYLTTPTMYKRERFLLKAASYLSTRWEFSIVYQTSQFLSDIDRVKEAVEEEIEDYYELIGVRKIALAKKLSHLVDLSGRLRFQKRWAQTPRVPETSVLGHMLVVAILGYFYALKIGACPKRVEYNFFCALFHDLPEALTRDIISPVKYSVSGLDDIISEYEMKQIEDAILPYIPVKTKDEFMYLLGLHGNGKDEFANRILDTSVKIVDSLEKYNEDRFCAIDGEALKNCDRLGAFIEATLSISHGVKSKELLQGKEYIKEKLREKGQSQGVDFYALACEVEAYLSV
ncbi:HD family hydrolase [Sulfurospirillum sp. T05]|uniref:HD family hydrolase n=1 Tax=Sulfurospirillum tamanense TaxID=2813362 RepID=A0ABS2WR54_9BACT|nr:HD family hydrolase [Sulfurospirillum tamanensis]